MQEKKRDMKLLIKIKEEKIEIVQKSITPQKRRIQRCTMLVIWAAYPMENIQKRERKKIFSGMCGSEAWMRLTKMWKINENNK